MSYSSWTTCGYGFCVDPLSEYHATEDNMRKFIAASPRLIALQKEGKLGFVSDEAGYVEWYDDNTFINVDECRDDFLTFILLTALTEEAEEVYGIKGYIFADDFDDRYFILFPQMYPWELANGIDFPKSETEIDEMCRLVFARLYGEDVPIIDMGYYTVENGG